MSIRNQRGVTLLEILIVLVILFVIFGVAAGGIGVFSCGVFGGKNKRDAEIQLVEMFGPEGMQEVSRYNCMNRDTNGDQYVTCTVRFKDGRPEERYDCDGYILVGVGSCKPVEYKVRVDGFGYGGF